MVDPSMPWSLKGISDEAREFAKQAADGSQTPVGAWLSAVIRSAAAQEAGTGNLPPTDPAPETAAPSPAVSASDNPPPADRTAGSTIERAAQIVGDFGFEPEGPALDADLIHDPARLQSELNALERRLEESETVAGQNLAPLIDEIERIKTRLEALKKH
tara:strand:- start:3085 stop:3561 length:477 start_codon:yes stop_codon:yes gene_type:complete